MCLGHVKSKDFDCTKVIQNFKNQKDTFVSTTESIKSATSLRKVEQNCENLVDLYLGGASGADSGENLNSYCGVVSSALVYFDNNKQALSCKKVNNDKSYYKINFGGLFEMCKGKKKKKPITIPVIYDACEIKDAGRYEAKYAFVYKKYKLDVKK
tara:strand:+ start:25761 stop:26225 length:465 start_codon:yes stop_codon:yes gene_type:complete